MYWKPEGIRTVQRISALGAVLSLQLTRCAYQALWPLNVTLAFTVACCVSASKPPPRVYLSGRYHRSLAVNSAGPHCYVIAACSTVTRQRGRKWRSDSLSNPLPPFLLLPEINLLLNLSFHRGACSGHLPHEGESDGSRDKRAIWQPNSDFKKLKDDSRGQIGMRELLHQYVKHTNLIWT